MGWRLVRQSRTKVGGSFLKWYIHSKSIFILQLGRTAVDCLLLWLVTNKFVKEIMEGHSFTCLYRSSLSVWSLGLGGCVNCQYGPIIGQFLEHPNFLALNKPTDLFRLFL